MPITLILPYYNQPEMLALQLQKVAYYPADLKVIVVDDGSPEAALDVIQGQPQHFKAGLSRRLKLFRILEDIPWNREQARNLGAYVSRTKWIIQADIDHTLEFLPACQVLQEIDEGVIADDKWYRFPRYRSGRADDTRQKDQIPADDKYGLIKPHMDSYLITRSQFLASPYDESYAGCLGGGTPFNNRMIREFGQPEILNEGIYLTVHTKDSVPDASITTLSRDTSEYSKRRKAIGGNDKPETILHHPWEQVEWT